MKKLAALPLICALLCCSAFSCGSEDSPKASESSSVLAETTEEASAEPATEPVTEPATEPVTENVPRTEPATETETVPATEPETSPAAEPATSPETVKIDVNAEAALRTYVQTAVSSSAEEIVKLIYPESLYNVIIDSNAISVFGDGGDSDAGLEDLSVTSCIGLSPDPYYMAVQEYYSKTAEAVGATLAEPIIVDRAYDVNATIKASYGGNVATDVVPAVVVHLDNIGWKTIPMSAAELLEVIK